MFARPGSLAGTVQRRAATLHILQCGQPAIPEDDGADWAESGLSGTTGRYPRWTSVTLGARDCQMGQMMPGLQYDSSASPVYNLLP